MDFTAYVATLPDDHVEALQQICSDFFAMHEENRRAGGNNWKALKTHEYKSYFRISQNFVDGFELGFEHEHVELNNEKIFLFFRDFDSYITGLAAEEIFRRKFLERTESIRLNEAQVAEIQTKTNALRDIVTKADYVTEQHRERLLQRLEIFQRELHKPISSRDRFFAGWREVNEMLEETGEKGQPIVDRFKDIMEAVNQAGLGLLGRRESPKRLTDQSNSPEAEE